jgi:hypothetical protein
MQREQAVVGAPTCGHNRNSSSHFSAVSLGSTAVSVSESVGSSCTVAFSCTDGGSVHLF